MNMEKLVRCIDRLTIFGGYVSGILIMAAGSLVLAEIFLRGLFNSTLGISDEYTGYLMAIVSLLSLAFAEKGDCHIRIAFLDRFSERGKCLRFLIPFRYLVGLVFAAILFYVTSDLFLESVKYGSRSLQISETPLAYPQFLLPVGAMLLFLEYLRKIIMFARGK